MSNSGGSEDDTVKFKKFKDPGSLLVGVLAFAIGGGTGTVSTLAVTKASVDRLTVQVEKLETRVETILLDRVTRGELESYKDKIEREFEKLRAELQKPR